MAEHPINNLMDTTLEKIKNMVDVNTIIGAPITTPDGVTLIPVSKVSYGFASGGSDLPTKTEKELFGGGSGAGISITPIAFLVISGSDVKMVHINVDSNTADKVVNLVPDMVDKIAALFHKDKKKNGDQTETPDHI